MHHARLISLPLTKEECLNSLKTMASDKTPGTDGLPAEFYMVFWEDIEGYLLNALNGAYENVVYQLLKEEV